MAEEKNAKNSPGAGDENTKNYVSRFLGVFLGEESGFSISLVISLMVSEILANYCSKRQMYFSPRVQMSIENSCKQISRGIFG